MSSLRSQRGFTLIELLITILIIVNLSSIALGTYIGQRQKSYLGRDIAHLELYQKAIGAARVNTNKTLGQITGNYFSPSACIDASGANSTGTWPADLPKTHVCWTTYLAQLNKIEAASGMSLDALKNGDANGNPYLLDENEDESASLPCRQDFFLYLPGKKVGDYPSHPFFLNGFSTSTNGIKVKYHLINTYNC